MTKTILWWFGGKGRLARRLIELMPKCDIYVEPFGGGAAVLLNRDPVSVEVYNDINRQLFDFFTVISKEDLFDQFKRRVEALPYHREFWNVYTETWPDQDDIVERVAQWFVVARQSFGGYHGRSWGSAVASSSRNRAQTVSSWMSALDRLPEIHARLQRVQFENQDFRTILDRYDREQTLFYCDPPYVTDTRSPTGFYPDEMTDDDHNDLVDVLLDVKGMVVLSGYPNKIYGRLEEAGWSVTDFETFCSSVARTTITGLQGTGSLDGVQDRTERVWRNPAAIQAIDKQMRLNLEAADES